MVEVAGMRQSKKEEEVSRRLGRDMKVEGAPRAAVSEILSLFQCMYILSH